VSGFKWYIGDWAAVDDDGVRVYELPDHAVSGFDLRDDPTSDGRGLFCCTDSVTGMRLVGDGDYRRLKSSPVIRQEVGEGDTLAEAVMSRVVSRRGQLRRDGRLGITIGSRKHVRVVRKQERKRILSEVRAKMGRAFAADPEQARKLLAMEVRKHGIGWKLLVPKRYRKNEFSPRRPSTTLTDSFTGGTDLSWTTHGGGTWTVSSDEYVSPSGGTYRAAVVDTALSSDDHETQVELVSQGVEGGTAYRHGAAVRITDQDNMYASQDRGSGTRMVKRVSGVETVLATGGTSPALPDTHKIEVDGSSLEYYLNGSSEGTATDTSISGVLTVGLLARNTGNFDDFTATDNAAGIVYVQLERDIRGVGRGLWTGTR